MPIRINVLRYKGFFSLVLMAVCDANYRFKLIDVGAYGRESDKQVYNSSKIKKWLDNDRLGNTFI